jgi:hypothetical protein
MKNCIVVIPIYKTRLTDQEEKNLKYSLMNLKSFQAVYMAPKNMDLSYYAQKFTVSGVITFPDEFFESPRQYSNLLLTKEFYSSFKEFRYTLILQPDAVVLKDELATWLTMEYDYIGAPWPGGIELPDLQAYLENNPGFTIKTFIGNGGLSLRQNEKILDMISRYPTAITQWQQKGNPEDLLISFLANFQSGFKVPNLATAARFSHEVSPRTINSLIYGELPFGIHAWEKYDREFWETHPKWPDELRN